MFFCVIWLILCLCMCIYIYTNSCVCVCVCIPSGSYLPGTSEMFATPRPSHSRETSFRLKKNCGLPHLKVSNPNNLEKKNRPEKPGASKLGLQNLRRRSFAHGDFFCGWFWTVGLGHPGWPNSLTHTGLMKGQQSALTAKKRPDHLLSCLALKRHLEVRIWPLKLNLGKQSF